jgi:hypothetical protein
MTIFLELVGCTGWTSLSDDHSCRLTSLVSIPASDLEPTIPWSRWAKHYLDNTTGISTCGTVTGASRFCGFDNPLGMIKWPPNDLSVPRNDADLRL